MNPLSQMVLDPSATCHTPAPSGYGDAAQDALARPRRSILLIDETTMTRECLEHMLRTRAQDIAVEYVAQVGEASMPRSDLVLLNINSARVDDDAVLDRVAEVRQRLGTPPIVIVTHLDDDRLAMEAIRQDIRGYVPTSLGPDIAVAAIRLVLAGGIFVPKGLIAHYASAAETTAQETRQPDPKPFEEQHGLTCREAEVLWQLRQGKPNKIIAHELSISESTVKVHVRSIMKKLHATNRTQVVFLAQKPFLRAMDLVSLPTACANAAMAG